MGASPTLAIASGPSTTSLNFNLWFMGLISVPLSFDFVAYQGNDLAKSWLVSWDGGFDIVENVVPAFLDRSQLDASIVPEPTSLVVWSLLGSLAVGLGWYRRRKSQIC